MRKHSVGITPWAFVAGLLVSLYVSLGVEPTWQEQRLRYELQQGENGQWRYHNNGQWTAIEAPVPYQQSPLSQARLDIAPPTDIEQQWVTMPGQHGDILLLKGEQHWGLWSFVPALLAIVLCITTREPLVALFSGVLSAAVILGRLDITDAVLIPSLASTSAASLLLLYLWLLGSLMGMWAKTGAALAFAETMTRRFVRGPRSAKFIAWCLGVVFFQGGTISTVLVGTTVKPMADKAKVSHEELSYVVDSTASPIAVLLAFNAWPLYVQGMIFVPGVAFLATEADRLAFFFSSLPFSFYAIFAVLGTLLLALDKNPFLGKGMKNAIERAKTTGALDAAGANPLSAKELHTNSAPADYRGSSWEFVLPLLALIGVSVMTFVATGAPKVTWGFAAALCLSLSLALYKGMRLNQVVDGLGIGLKGVVVASVILMLAMTLGNLSKELGGGIYLVERLGETLTYWLLPILLLLFCMFIAFSTGTSWGTFAIVLPLAMPLAWAISQAQGIGNPELYMMICFATVLNGAVYGDQCSPISDTTVLSAMTTGCDLMDHVRTQIVPASYAAGTAAVLWVLATLLLV